MTTLQEHQPTHRILRLKQVLEYTGLSKSTVYDLLNAKSPRHDPTFPKSIQLTTSSVGWIDREVNDWIESRIAKSRS